MSCMVTSAWSSFWEEYLTDYRTVTRKHTFGMSGFGKDPTNPFYNNIALDSRLTPPAANAMYSANRQPPLFEFNTGRLFLDPNANSPSGSRGYYDSLGNAARPQEGYRPSISTRISAATATGRTTRMTSISHLSPQHDRRGRQSDRARVPVRQRTLRYLLRSQPVHDDSEHNPPNPYTGSRTSTGATSTVTFQKAQTFQILSPGLDGLYGVGGQFVPASTLTSTSVPLMPFDPLHIRRQAQHLCRCGRGKRQEHDVSTAVAAEDRPKSR